MAEHRKRIEVGIESPEFIDIQRIAREAEGGEETIALSDRAIELFDVAFFEIDGTFDAYLRNTGVRPLKGEELILPDFTDDSLGDMELAFFVGGFPEADTYEDHDRRALVTNLRTFPLHPHPDGPGMVGRRAEGEEGNFLWIPAGWRREDWDTDITGVSGGPALVLVNGSIHLFGLVARQRSVASGTREVGIILTDGVIEMICIHFDRIAEENSRQRKGPPDSARGASH